MTTLSPEVLALVEMSPVETLLLALLDDKFPGIKVQSLIEPNQIFPFVLVRRTGDWGEWNGDPRFLDSGQITINAFASGIEADTDAALLAEAVRVTLRDSRNVVVPDVGHITSVRMMASPVRKTDWGTAVGPVQVADLPSNVFRYEATYQISIRKSLTKPFPPGP